MRVFKDGITYEVGADTAEVFLRAGYVEVVETETPIKEVPTASLVEEEKAAPKRGRKAKA